MWSVVVGVEDVFDGLGREAFAIGHGAARAAGKVGIDDHQIIFHLDDHVIAVALFHIAFAEPDTGSDQANGFRRGVGTRDEQSDGGKRSKPREQTDPEPQHGAPPIRSTVHYRGVQGRDGAPRDRAARKRLLKKSETSTLSSRLNSSHLGISYAVFCL